MNGSLKKKTSNENKSLLQPQFGDTVFERIQ